MKHIVDGIGLDWASQFVKLKQIVNQVVMIFIITDFLVMCLKQKGSDSVLGNFVLAVFTAGA